MTNNWIKKLYRFLENHTQAASHLTDKQMELEKAYFELLNIKDIIACVARNHST